MCSNIQEETNEEGGKGASGQKVRTGYLGCGDPKENNGYLGGGCSSSEHLDPESKIYALLKSVGM